MKMPQTDRNYEALPENPQARKEALQDVCGEHLLKLQQVVLHQVDDLIKSPEKREALGSIRARPYASVAEMPELYRQKALELARSATRLYIQYLMATLDDEGVHLKLGHEHHIHFGLSVEILRSSDGKLIEEHEINRSPLPTLGEKFGKWMSRVENKITHP